MALTDNLRAYWSFDTNNDSAVNGYNGTSVNSPTYTAGKISDALTLVRASSQYVSMPNGVLPFGTNTYTVNMWVKFAAAFTNDTGRSLTMTSRTGQGLLLYAYRTGAGAYLIDHSKPNVVGLAYTWSGFNTNWNMWTFRGDSSGMKTFLNGTQVATNTNSSNIVAPSTDTIEFGAYRFAGSIQSAWYLDGQMDEVGIWDRSLTTTEITELYNSGAGLAYPFAAGGVTKPQFLGFAGL